MLYTKYLIFYKLSINLQAFVFIHFEKEHLSCKSALNHIQKKYLLMNSDRNKTIYCHLVSAIDKSDVKFVWKSLHYIFSNESLKKFGFI